MNKLEIGQVSKADARSRITIQCLQTKFGTRINREEVPPGDHDLNGDEHDIVLGKAPYHLKIVWQPAVLSFSLGSKEFKRIKDPIKDVRKRLDTTDIICLPDYEKSHTTHVVASKRNTPKGLQALVNGKYLVHPTFVDELVACTTPENLDEPESFCPLELDFDGQWPDALKYLPPTKDPIGRPIEDFAPNRRRAEVFEGYTFVFCDQVQFDALHAPITDGGGKALHFAVERGVTETPELVRFVKSVAGEKGLGEFDDGSEGKGVVVVRIVADKESQWAEQFVRGVSLATGQRMIEQNEFLEAILSNDASMLRRPLPLEDESNAPDDSQGVAQPTQPEITQASIKPESSPGNLRERRARRAAAKRFKGFDDQFDDTPVPAPGVISPNMQSHAQPSSSVKTKRHIGFNDDIEDEEDQPTTNEAQASEPTETRKRPAPEDEDEEMIDAIIPAAAALKRRRIAEKQDGNQRTVSAQPATTFAQAEAKKPRKEIDIKEEVRKRREAEEDARRRDEESLQETMQGMDVGQMKNLAVVEEMELPVRSCQRLNANADGAPNDRWDDKWNGRKNFKRFRRHGQANQARRGQTVIVPLQEVKKKGYGIGEEYWLNSESTDRRKRKDKERITQTQSQRLTDSKSQQQPQEMHEVPAELVIEGESSEIINVDAPRQTRHAEHTEDSRQSGTIPQFSGTNRSAPTSSSAGQAGTSIAKRPRRAVSEDSDSESSDDGMKFKYKFKRRKRQ